MLPTPWNTNHCKQYPWRFSTPSALCAKIFQRGIDLIQFRSWNPSQNSQNNNRDRQDKKYRHHDINE